MSGPEQADEPITAAGLEALKSEIEQLQTTGRQEIAKRILAARELGDLKENAEYHIAKEDQAHLETRIKRLRERLRRAVVVDPDTTRSAFGFGRTADVLDEAGGKLHTWTIVGAAEADVSQGKLSAESPVAKALLGHGAGDAIDVQTPSGPRRYRIERIH